MLSKLTMADVVKAWLDTLEHYRPARGDAPSNDMMLFFFMRLQKIAEDKS